VSAGHGRIGKHRKHPGEYTMSNIYVNRFDMSLLITLLRSLCR
jgi:hypothetical protein